MNKTNFYTILTVNDIPDQLELMAFILREAGYQVLCAENGIEGLKIARREIPDLIISDVMMPEMDGIEFCRQVRADKHLTLIPFLLVSAMRKDTESVVKGLEADADDYIEAPYENLRLVAKVAQLIERKKTNDVLRENEIRFRSMIENITDIISILAPDGTVIYESPSVEAILGYTPEELIGQNAFDFVHPQDTDQVIEYFNTAISGVKPAFPLEYRFRHKDNSWRSMESVGNPYHDATHGLVAIITSRDITETKKLEEQLSQSQKLESVGKLAGGIAHDFNNMLTAINGYSELSLRRLPQDDPLRRNIEEIKKAGERSADLTRQLLAFSRQQVLKTKMLNLNDVIIDVSSMLERLIGEDIRLNIILNPQLWVIEADPGQLST